MRLFVYTRTTRIVNETQNALLFLSVLQDYKCVFAPEMKLN